MVACGYMHVHILQKLQYSNMLYLRYIIYLTHSPAKKEPRECKQRHKIRQVSPKKSVIYTLLRGNYRLQQNWNQIYNQWLFCMTIHSVAVSKGVYDYLTTNYNCYSCDMSLHLWWLVDIMYILQKLQYSNILYLRYIIYLTLNCGWNTCK